MRLRMVRSLMMVFLAGKNSSSFGLSSRRETRAEAGVGGSYKWGWAWRVLDSQE